MLMLSKSRIINSSVKLLQKVFAHYNINILDTYTLNVHYISYYLLFSNDYNNFR